MTTETEVKLARYSEVQKEADKLGRIIGVRRLKPSEQTKVAGFTSELTGYDEGTNASGDKIRLPHRMPLFVAASVCYIHDGINEVHVPFPRSRAELDAMYDRLDMEGMEAATVAMMRLMPLMPDDADPKEEAKN